CRPPASRPCTSPTCTANCLSRAGLLCGAKRSRTSACRPGMENLMRTQTVRHPGARLRNRAAWPGPCKAKRRLFASSLALLMLALPASATALPSYDEVKADAQASDVQVLDRSGRPMERVRVDFQARRGDWIALDNVSVALQRAVILSEDRRFYTHGGVDWRAGAGAGRGLRGHEGGRGAADARLDVAGTSS